MAVDKLLFPFRSNIRNAELLYLEYTVASGTVTAVTVPNGWSLGNFSSGIAALTFPKHYNKFYPFEGQENTTNASATSRHQLETKTIVVASGTASVICVDQNDGTVENPVDGTFRLAYVVGD